LLVMRLQGGRVKFVRLLSAWVGAIALLASFGAVAATAKSRAAKVRTQNSRVAQASNGPQTIVATPVARVVGLDPPNPIFGHTTLLESPVFGPKGLLYFVDLTAPAGAPKVLTFNLKTHGVKPIYTDATSGFSSIQFSPADSKAYLTDYLNGKIDRMNADGSGFTTQFEGPIDGTPSNLDDIAFTKDGSTMYVTDSAGDILHPVGRVLRFSATGTDPQVLATGIAGANGISFAPGFGSLWVSELQGGRELHYTLAPDGTFSAGAVGMYANMGVGAFDSNTVDAAGNVYQCVPNVGKVIVWNPQGDVIANITVPQTYPKPQLLTTNLAIKPGTTDGYMVVGGENGGYIYHFDALAKGIMQSNGGGKVFK
jgi:lactonase